MSYPLDKVSMREPDEKKEDYSLKADYVAVLPSINDIRSGTVSVDYVLAILKRERDLLESILTLKKVNIDILEVQKALQEKSDNNEEEDNRAAIQDFFKESSYTQGYFGGRDLWLKEDEEEDNE